MSDGEESKRRQSDSKAWKKAGPDNYGRAVSRVAVAQVCESVGFDGVKDSALEALSDVAVRFIRELGKSAVYHSNVAGRSEPNVFDVVKGLEDTGSVRGFPGASGLDFSATSSGALKEITDFVYTVEEIPFARKIPQFPVCKSNKGLNSLQTCNGLSGYHIPAWLPPFPDPHAYVSSPTLNGQETDFPADKMEQVKQQRKAEKSLSILQQRILSGSAAGPSGSGNHSNPLEELEVEFNPFLKPAIPACEKEVSPITVPEKLVNHELCKKNGPFSEIFAPGFNVMEKGEVDSMKIDRSLPLDNRPVVSFRLKAHKRILGKDLDVRIGDRGNERRESTIGTDEERDEKKRKAQLILQQSIENPQELTQM